MDSIEVQRRERLLAELGSLRGVEALYREGSRFCRARVGDFEAGNDELAVRLDLVPTCGLDGGVPVSWKIAMRWDRLESADDFWVSTYIGMKLYFEPGLVASIVRRVEGAACERYDREQFERIVGWIERYRKSELARRLTGELTLFHDDRPIGAVTEYFLAEYPQVHGKFAVAEIDDEAKAELRRYRVWRKRRGTRRAANRVRRCGCFPDAGDWSPPTAGGRSA